MCSKEYTTRHFIRETPSVCRYVSVELLSAFYSTSYYVHYVRIKETVLYLILMIGA